MEEERPAEKPKTEEYKTPSEDPDSDFIHLMIPKKKQ
jgi:hypothetical protein